MDNLILKLQLFTLEKLLPAALILFGGLAAQRAAPTIINVSFQKTAESHKFPLVEQGGRIKTLGNVLKNMVSLIITFVSLSMALSKSGIDIAPILAGAGVVGLAVGFGAQTFVRDVVTGFFILFENQFNIGDAVQIANLRGTVKEIKLRTTILQDDQGAIHIIPNSQISTVTKIPATRS